MHELVEKVAQQAALIREQEIVIQNQSKGIEELQAALKQAQERGDSVPTKRLPA